MKNVNLIISPQTKVGELLDAYPELEKVLFELSPAFSKLKNPILRKNGSPYRFVTTSCYCWET